MSTIKLTAKQTALMTAIADGHFSFFDQGLVAESGIWMACLTEEIAGTDYNVSATAKGAATVASSLVRKGLLVVSAEDEDGNVWVELTEEGAAWIAEHNAEDAAPAAPAQEELPVISDAEDAAPVAAAPEEAPVIQARKEPEQLEVVPDTITVLCDECGQPHLGEYSHHSEHGQGPIYAVICTADGKDLTDYYTLEAAWEAPAAAPAKKGKKAAAAAAAPAKAAPVILAHVPTEHDGIVEVHDTYEVTQWAEEVEGYGVTEWIRTEFTDGSWTLRRRRNVSGAWRTDFWGQEAGADKKVFTTSGAAKKAREAGTFKA